MSGQETIIYKKRISEKAVKVYNKLTTLPKGSHKSFDEVCTLCSEYDSDNVYKALEQLVEAELITCSEDNKRYSLNPNKRIIER